MLSGSKPHFLNTPCPRWMLCGLPDLSSPLKYGHNPDSYQDTKKHNGHKGYLVS